ncbi:TlpA disulfide reductase family protein [Aliibacillus thermotolerans]|uniref:TlpA disulfide reductase family protein n=1 Tax=Aliibacillus thermotolerans TaxID=1834418 RepID=A0ABW0U7M8_9BACI|nr:TlpA disulfide reductase family protein [Aliibacillus thermotolerans]MDA3130146.1 redoxin domain-containing protein [Aliibacillus thermotolerans]
MQAMKFSLKEMNNDHIVHLEDLKGTPILLTFWTSWCPDSAFDLMKKQALYEHMDPNRLKMLMINVIGREREANSPQKFIEKNGFTFPVVMDEGRKTYDAYGCEGVPSTFILNERLEIVHSYGEKATFIEIMEGVNQVINT